MAQKIERISWLQVSRVQASRVQASRVESIQIMRLESSFSDIPDVK